MDKEKFIEMINHMESKVVAVDFDGVIHKSSLGFHDGTVYDDPVPGAKEALEALSEYYEVVIYSCKANPDRPHIKGRSGTEIIWDWLEKEGMSRYVSRVCFKKPNAICYVDDKGIRFNNWEQALQEISEL